MEYVNEMMDLGTLQQMIKENRKRRNMSYQELADKTKLSKSTLQRYETKDIKNIPFESVIRIAAALGINPVELFIVNSDAILADLVNTKLYETQTLVLQDFIEYEKKVQSILLPALIADGYKVNMLDDKNVGDILAVRGSERWYIDYHYERDYQLLCPTTGQNLTQLQLRFGKVAMSMSNITKYSLVESDSNFASLLIKAKPNYLSLDYSVILLTDNQYQEFHP